MILARWEVLRGPPFVASTSPVDTNIYETFEVPFTYSIGLSVLFIAFRQFTVCLSAKLISTTGRVFQYGKSDPLYNNLSTRLQRTKPLFQVNGTCV